MKYHRFFTSALTGFSVDRVCIWLMAILLGSNVHAQDRKDELYKGAGFVLKPGGAYYVDYAITPARWAELKLLTGYGSHVPKISNMDKTTVKGWYAGGGISLLTAPMRKNYNEEKSVNGSLKVSFSLMAGKVSMNSKKIFQGEEYEDFVLRYSMKNEWFKGFEWKVGYELNFDDEVKLGLYPFILCGGSYSGIETFELEFLPGLGYIFTPIPGISLQYIW